MPHITKEQLLQRNRDFAAHQVPQPFSSEQVLDSAHTIVISCYDPRSTPEEFLNINLRGREVVCIRNAGGHTQHIVHDIVTLDKLLRIDDILVIHHRDCGLTHMTDEGMKEDLRKRTEGKKLGQGEDFETFEFGCMTDETLAASAKVDLKFLKDHPWIREETNVWGFVFDIKTGLLNEIEV